MSSNLRIALFSGNYNYQADGANKALNKLVAFLESRAVEVRVFSPTSPHAAFEAAGQITSVPSIPLPGRGEYRVGFSLNKNLRQQIKSFNPQLFHLSAPDILGHSALNFSKALGIPAIASFHTRFDTYFKYYKLGWVEPYCRKKMAQFYERCAQVYVPSHSIGRVLQDDGILGSNMRIWSRGIERHKFSPKFRDMDWRRKNGIEDSDVVLSFVGRLVREKGLDVYADLIDSLTARGLPVKPLIVGDGPEFEKMKTRLPHAVMTGHVSGEDLSRAYASSDIFINPSLTETFGNVTLEAMASGVPTICLNATGSVDLVDHGITGWLANSDKEPAWIEKTIGLVKDKDSRIQMGRMGRLKSEDYDWNTIMQGLLDDYRQVISQSRAYQFDENTALNNRTLSAHAS